MRKLSVLAVMMTFALVGCGKKEAKLPPEGRRPGEAPLGSSKQGPPGGIVPAGGVGVVVNPGAALGGGGGGGGAAQAVRKAARRAQAMNELKNLAETIEAMRDPIGKMPSKDAILAEAKKSLPMVFEGLTQGAYVLADPMQPGGLWAYEADADTKAGLAVIGGRVTRSTPDDLQPYFAAMPKQAAPSQPVQPPVVQPPAQTAAVSKKDMEDIHLFIETASSASGKMPDGTTVYNALVQSKSPAAELIRTQAIYLLQPKVRESVWAAEAKAYTQGGMVVTNNGVETVTAAELKKRTGQ